MDKEKRILFIAFISIIRAVISAIALHCSALKQHFHFKCYSIYPSSPFGINLYNSYLIWDSNSSLCFGRFSVCVRCAPLVSAQHQQLFSIVHHTLRGLRSHRFECQTADGVLQLNESVLCSAQYMVGGGGGGSGNAANTILYTFVCNARSFRMCTNFKRFNLNGVKRLMPECIRISFGILHLRTRQRYG